MKISRKAFKDNLIDVSAHVFNRFGFSKTTMEDIAMAIGKKKSTLYYYFRSKEEIFQAVLEKEAATFREKIINEIIVTKIPPHEKLRGYILLRLEFLSGFGNYYDFIMRNIESHYSTLEKVRQRFDKEEEELIGQIADEGIQNGVFRLSDKTFAAKAMLTIIKGFELSVFVSKMIAMDELEKRVDELLDILLYGLVLDKKDHNAR
jgi:AcrR family transcriptional regulator